MNITPTTYIVYVQRDESKNITAVNSSAFLEDTTGWVKIDEGEGDKYHHAQSNYFDKPIITSKGVYRYRLIYGAVVEKTEAEIAAEETVIIAARQNAAQIDTLKKQLAATDYKIIKCYEHSLASLDLPYDIASLHADRQAIRDQINALEA